MIALVPQDKLASRGMARGDMDSDKLLLPAATLVCPALAPQR